MTIDFDWNTLIIVLPFIFAGGFVDSIAGGGGVLSWIGFLIAGVPMHISYSTNKIQALAGTSVSSYNYIKAGHFNKWFLPFAIVGAILGSSIGSYVVTTLDDATLKMIITVVLPFIALMMAFSRKSEKAKNRKLSKGQIFITSGILGLAIGLYDGFIGPGAGTFLIVGFSMLGLSLLEAGGNAKIINLITSLSASIIFITGGFLDLGLVIPCIIVNIVANHLGSKLAISGGEKIIRPVMLSVMVMLVLKLASDVLL
ncbi:sulfite exporter TauE/SafE family protein [Mycoplasma sp. P36-A1]|uniref:sulfite exporter TauE/SafE family protein n=1 Tax=Mycoplasma sp. P36-A1 TaxID=3252900 RepID=UPI003C2FED3C